MDCNEEKHLTRDIIEEDRRYKLAAISVRDLISLPLRGLPPGAFIVNAWIDHGRNSLVLQIGSERFGPVPVGSEMPFIQTPMRINPFYGNEKFYDGLINE